MAFPETIPTAPATPSVVEDLARSVAYPPPTPQSVSVHTTHASWVFLTETDVRKIKRPVNYGFLDFSSADKRRRCCGDEVRLGKRFAPDVYLGVVPVYLGPSGYTFTGPGEIVDHAVWMRRLADEDSARSLLRDGRLGFGRLGSLAEQLALFYEATNPTPEFGAPAILASAMAENFEQTAPYFDLFVDGAEIEKLYRWQQGVLFAQEGRLRERIANGRIREGHGDLRLEHVYFPREAPGRAVVIDPIEFNTRFRCGDVALDVAFFAMELEASGRARLAAYFLSRFARATDDYGFYPLLDLYLSYRAWIRAKVACFVAADPSTPVEKARGKVAKADRFFSLAASYASRPTPPTPVIAVGGMIGAGKSSLADKLSRRLGVPVISSDVVRKRLAGIRPAERGDAALYSEENTRRTYGEMTRRAQSVLDSGRGVILDGTFRSPTLRGIARSLAYKNDRPFRFVELACDDQTLGNRITARAKTSTESDAQVDLLPAFRGSFEPAAELTGDESVVLDGRLPTTELARRICDGWLKV